MVYLKLEIQSTFILKVIGIIIDRGVDDIIYDLVEVEMTLVLLQISKQLGSLTTYMYTIHKDISLKKTQSYTQDP